jgi:hypothetical protein
MYVFTLATSLLAVTASAFPSNITPRDSFVNQTTCNGKTYTYESLAGYGFVPHNARDKFGDTIGGIGSSVAFEPGTWKSRGGNGYGNDKSKSYEAIIWTLPDRGWNTKGTLNFQSRLHKFKVQFNPSQTGPKPNLQLQYLDTVLLFAPDGSPTTGLDADATGALKFPGFPDLPAATYTGDGYGGPGKGGHRVSIDCEGLVVNEDGTFWISDEYGPYIYLFSHDGKMLQAVRPPDAFIPLRNGTESFNSNTAPYFDPNRTVIPTDPTQGRANNQGFEGLTLSPDGKTLTVLTQSALMQEGGTSSKNRFNARLLQYDLSPKGYGGYGGYGNKPTPQLKAEYVVQLPKYINAKGDQRIAAQSEIHAVSATQFLILSRDSGAGKGADSSLSVYRHADVFDISNATNFLGKYDAFNQSIASSKGELVAGITPAVYCSWLDYNVNSQLAQFGLHNGGAQDSGLLNEKWESLALVPVDDKGGKGHGGKDDDYEEYFLFSFSDNDFVTTEGYLNFGRFKYQDDFDAENQALVFKVKIPKV